MSQKEPLEERSPPRSPRVQEEPEPKQRRCEHEAAQVAAAEADCSGHSETPGRWLQPRPVFDRSLILAPMVSCFVHFANDAHASAHVTRHTSHVTRHTSYVTRHTSHVTRASGPCVHSPHAPSVPRARCRLCERSRDPSNTDTRVHRPLAVCALCFSLLHTRPYMCSLMKSSTRR
jgi:hypothetical protein